MNDLLFERARVTAIEHKISNGSVTSKIKCVALFTGSLAAEIGAEWVIAAQYDYRTINLDLEITDINVALVVPQMPDKPLLIQSELADHFVVTRRKDEVLLIGFTITHAGSPFDLLEHLIHVGGTEGNITITAQQRELFKEPLRAAEMVQ